MAKRTNWQKIMQDILTAQAPKGFDTYNLQIIASKTGIGVSTLSRLHTGDTTNLYYDLGIKLMALHTYLKETKKLK